MRPRGLRSPWRRATNTYWYHPRQPTRARELAEARDDAGMDVAYITLVPAIAPGDAARTIEVGTSFQVDVDTDGRVLGVEVFGNADWRDALTTLVMEGTLRVPSKTRSAN